jgi:hypothetical protein
MRGFDVGMVSPQGQRLGLAQGFLKFRGQFVESHGFSWKMMELDCT